MDFIDLKAQQIRIQSEISNRIHSVLKNGKYIMGPEVFELEKRLSKFVNVKHCISCSSGTDALLMALMAWKIGPGDAVFIPPFTFIATAEVIQLLGAKPVFVDIDEKTFNIDPEKLEQEIVRIQRENQFNPKAIITVDLFGLPADYLKIESIATKHGLFLLEDAAQSFGGSIGEKMAGSFGDMAATSFFPAKPLGCYGDGGAIFTNNDLIAEKLISIRIHGKGENKYDNVRIGINGRLDTFQAAILLEKLTIFPSEFEMRNLVASQYTEKLLDKVVTPFIPENYKSVWAQYSVLTESSENRKQIQNKLQSQGIPTAIYYPKPLHLQMAFNELEHRKGDFQVSESVSDRILSLPMHPYLSESDIDKITRLI